VVIDAMATYPTMMGGISSVEFGNSVLMVLFWVLAASTTAGINWPSAI